MWNSATRSSSCFVPFSVCCPNWVAEAGTDTGDFLLPKMANLNTFFLSKRFTPSRGPCGAERKSRKLSIESASQWSLPYLLQFLDISQALQNSWQNSAQGIVPYPLEMTACSVRSCNRPYSFRYLQRRCTWFV